MRATLLFLPGTLCDGRLWEAQHQALSSEYPCAVADYRLEESIGAMATAALAQVAGPIIPIGLSMGGMVALEIWRQAPKRVVAMALFDTDPGADTPARRKSRDAQIVAATHGGLRSVVETRLAPSYLSPGSSGNPALRRRIVEMALDQGVGAFAAQVTALATRRDSWPVLGRIRVPVLVACGEDDRICPPHQHRRMASVIPKATFICIEAAGHLPSLEQSEATTRILQSWLLALPGLESGRRCLAR